MKHAAAHICNFEAVPDLPRKITYADFKHTVLEAGRFSVFEATETQYKARLFDKLCRDPEIETIPLGIPLDGSKSCAIYEI